MNEHISRNNLGKRILVASDITKCAQLRVVAEARPYVFKLQVIKPHTRYESHFTCGIDIMKLEDGRHVITSVLGISGTSFLDFVENLIKLHPIREKAIAFYFCDDSDWIEENQPQPLGRDVLLTLGNEGMYDSNEEESWDDWVESKQIEKLL